MNDVVLPRSWLTFAGARRTGIVARVVTMVAPAIALACAAAASGRTVPLVDAVVVALAVATALLPDSHLGLAVLAAVAGVWFVTVDDVATPWAVGAAVALVVFHTAASAAATVPPAARWTRAMHRRWGRRVAATVVATAAAWGAVALLHGATVAGSSVFVGATFVASALGVAWVSPRATTRGRRRG